jgi:hypothetical protein
MRTFRVFNTISNETILILKKKDLCEASYWVFKNYGDTDSVDIEELKE